MSNQLMTVDQFKKQLAVHHKGLNSVLPSHIPADKFSRTILNAVQNNPDILESDPNSIFNECQKAAQDGLLLDGREAALVVYNSKVGGQWVKKASYQPMIGGILKKIRNSGELLKIDVIAVHKNDHFKYNPSVDIAPDHAPDWFGKRGDFVGVYAVAHLKNGSTAIEIMNIDEIEEIRKTSKSGADKNTGEAIGIWKKHYVAMAKKSCLKRLAKYLPSSADVDQFATSESDFSDYEEIEEVDPPKAKPAKPARTRAAQIVAPEPKPAATAVDNDVVTVDPITGEILEGGVAF